MTLHTAVTVTGLKEEAGQGGRLPEVVISVDVEQLKAGRQTDELVSQTAQQIRELITGNPDRTFRLHVDGHVDSHFLGAMIAVTGAHVTRTCGPEAKLRVSGGDQLGEVLQVTHMDKIVAWVGAQDEDDSGSVLDDDEPGGNDDDTLIIGDGLPEGS